jgi:hypothetical protein
MKRVQPSRWIIAVLVTIAGTSVADVNDAVHETTPAPGREVPIDTTGVPPECRQFLAIPVDSTSELLPWSQRLSVAACRQSIALAPVSDPERFRAMVANLEHAMAPSLAIYRDAMAHGPTQIRILGAYGLGMTNLNIIVRARSTVRVADSHGTAAYGGATYGAMTYIDPYLALHRALDPLLAGERENALAAFREVARLASEDPAAARANQVMLVVIANARIQAILLR